VKSIYDLLTTIVFAGLAVLFLQRSVSKEDSGDRIYHYAPPAIGCAVANYLGNKGLDVAAGVLLAAVVAYSVVVLKPFPLKR
jgi:hypothetical protein